jgi:O-methyltransferase involved in polyketide biosynthesis
MTTSERQHIQAIIKYTKKPAEICYDEFAYKRMQSAYRRWLKNLLKYGHPGGQPNRRKGA